MAAEISSSLPAYSCVQCLRELSDDQIKRCSRCREAIYCGRECQTKHWKIHKTICLPTSILQRISHQYSKDNALIRLSFHKFATQVHPGIPRKFHYLLSPEYNHVLNTQDFILEGSRHLNPDTSVVVVCGAQFFDHSFIEPLPSLLERCKKLILVDIDKESLKALHKMLEESPKVRLVELDLSDALRDISSLEKRALQCSSPDAFFQEIIPFLAVTSKKLEGRKPLLLKELEPEDRVDYVISSLVSSQLGFKFKEIAFQLFENDRSRLRSQLTREQTSQLASLIYACNDCLAKNHVRDLCSWASPQGNIYYADTFRMGENLPAMIRDPAVGEIKSLLEKDRKCILRKWYWHETQKTCYPVSAMLQISR